MSGTVYGGHSANATIIKKYGITEDGKSQLMVRIGRLGGMKGTTGGFYARRDIARWAGTLGGRISRRGESKTTPEQRKRIRREFERNYKHLMKINRQAQSKVL